MPEEGVALDQEVVDNKENELVAAPKLLARLVLYKKVVCGDAMLTLTHRVWSIENGLHYRRDKTLQEDSIRMSHSGQAEAVAILHNFISSLFAKLGFSNHASAIRRFNAAIDRTLLLNFL